MRLTLAALLSLCSAAQASSDVVGVVVISRHGVRTPYGPTGGDLTPELMAPFTNRVFPDANPKVWGTNSTAELTPHGARVIHNMGEWFATAQRYQQLLTTNGEIDCSKLAVYADNISRDVLTAHSFITGMSPACSSVPIWTQQAAALFNEGDHTTAECGPATEEQTLSLIGGESTNGTVFARAYREYIDQVQDIVGCCNSSLCNGAPNCTIQTLPTEWIGQFWEAISGPVSMAGYFGSYFLLEALNNMTIAWNELTLDQAVDLDGMQVAGYGIVDNWWSAKSFASTLATYVIGSLDQAATGKSVPGMNHSPNQRFVYLAGHDTNLVLMRRLLNVEWLSEGWRENNPPPGGMLVFELHQRSDKTHFVRLFFETATPEQIRSATRFTTTQPSRVPIAVPGCPDSSGGGLDCDLEIFKQVVLGSCRGECVGMENLRSHYYKSSSSDSGKVEWWWVLVAGVCSLCFGFVLAVVVFRLQRRRNVRSGLGQPLV